MNLDGIRELVREITLVDATEISDIKLNGYINQAIHQIASERKDWPWLETIDTISVTAGTHTYSLPATARHIQSLILPDSTAPLGQISLRHGLSRAGRYTTTSTPKAYAVVGDASQLRLFPTPSKAGEYTLIFQGTPDELSQDGDTPPWDPAYHQVLVEYANYLVFRHEELENEAARARGEYYDQLRRMVDFYRSLTTFSEFALGDGGAFSANDRAGRN